MTSKKRLESKPTNKPGHNPNRAVTITVNIESRKKGRDRAVLIILKTPFNSTAATIAMMEKMNLLFLLKMMLRGIGS
jgi:hypothetical protein